MPAPNGKTAPRFQHTICFGQRLPEHVIEQTLQHLRHHHIIEVPNRPRNLLTISNLRTPGLSQFAPELLHRSRAWVEALHVDAP